MQELYLFSGLGADERVYAYIDFTGYRICHIKWIKPGANESISSYAQRLILQITAPNPVLIGVSFGGLIAIEVSKWIPVSKTIILSSAKTSREIPFYYKMIRGFGLQQILPFNLFTKPNKLTNWLFGARTTRDKVILAEILRATDLNFLKWAITQISGWKNAYIPPNLTHIHGDNDKVLPVSFIKNAILVSRGGHLMVLDRAGEISGLIRNALQGIE